MKLFEAPFGVRDNAHDWPLRAVLSSYLEDGTAAPPDGLSDCAMCEARGAGGGKKALRLLGS